jgi:long-subunit fatty acid transport protein
MYKQVKYRQITFARQAKRICVLLSCACISAFTLCSATGNNGRGAKAVGMANAFTSVADDAWAVVYNPAGLARIGSPCYSVFFIPAQFGMNELQTKAAAAAVPLRFLAIGVEAEQFGFELYRETVFAAGLAVNFDRFVSAGLGLNLMRFDISKYGSDQNFIMNAGILAQATQDLRFGFCMSNINRAEIGKQGETIPQIYSIGACWQPVEGLTLSAELEKDIGFPSSIKTGLEKILFGRFALRMGVSNQPDKYAAGFSVKQYCFQFGYAGYSHAELGWTHQIELSYAAE